MRGESGRVAERVSRLLNEYGRAPIAPPTSVPAQSAVLTPTAVPAPASLFPETVPAPAAPLAQPLPPNRHRAAAGWWTRLAARVPVRLDPGRRAAMAVGAAVLLAAVLTGAWVLAARPRALPVASTPSAVPGARSPVGTAAPRPRAPTPLSSSATLVVVDVTGKVRRPGLYRLPAGSRVDDAVRAAGGALPRVRLDSLNLAAKLVDGQQIAVGVAPAAGAGGALPVNSAGAGQGTLPAAGPVDLNTAPLPQLETLPGVGPVLAQHILDWRTEHGRFTSVDQLQDVSGIGPAKFAALHGLVSVS